MVKSESNSSLLENPGFPLPVVVNHILLPNDKLNNLVSKTMILLLVVTDKVKD